MFVYFSCFALFTSLMWWLQPGRRRAVNGRADDAGSSGIGSFE